MEKFLFLEAIWPGPMVAVLPAQRAFTLVQ
jgi:hypothetical protein